MLTVERTEIEGLAVLTPRVFADERGSFIESYNAKRFAELAGIDREWVQDNESVSRRGVLRGLHFQNPHPQGKLVRCVRGAVYDVAVDLRRSSPTFTDWFGIELSDENHRQLWIPEGFGHGFLALSDEATVLYKATAYYAPDADRAVRWDDPDIGVEWPLQGRPILSDKDRRAPLLADATVFD